jgi:NTE family protein
VPTVDAAIWPVEQIPTDKPEEGPRDETGLCLSGGGVRAMLFHLGALWRLNELGLLRGLDRVSSVSGGSITAGVLGTRWRELTFDPSTNVASNLEPVVIAPLRKLAGKNLDILLAVEGVFLPGGNPASRYAGALRKHLFGDATLQDLPSDDEGPRFIINATNLESGAVWRFSRPYAWDWRVGKIANPTFPVAMAVAASGAFPPFFAPLVLDVQPSDFEPGSGDGLELDAFRRKVHLADGGAYDNLGLETVFKRCRRIYVSDGGGKLDDDAAPASDWVRETLRTMKVIDNQVRSLRKRLLWSAYERGDRQGAYWGIRSATAEYRVDGALPCDPAATRSLAEMPTRLAKVPGDRQRALINWGYAIADAAIRAGSPGVYSAPSGFPYPGGVG